MAIDPTEVTIVVPVDAPMRDQWAAARADIKATWRERRIWTLAALISVGNRYRRTILGPWWLTLSTVFFVFGLSFLRVGLGGGDLKNAVPYVGLGFIIFGLIAGGINVGSSTYVQAGAQLSTSQRPYSTYPMQGNAVQFIDFLHDAVVIIVIALFFSIPFTLAWGLSVLATFLIVASSIGVGLWLGPLAARFRDVGPLVSMVMRLMFFLTPIFWSIDQVTTNDRAWLAWWNPLTYQLLAFRDPILGTSHGLAPYVVTTLLAVGNLALGIVVFTKSRARIPYWVAE
ncbi:MAG: ABC transporter permease [Candidatus Nanopelagicales bacterium]|nr:ABC transporter permease [Candidatus Nanopelagicales bacterium]